MGRSAQSRGRNNAGHVRRVAVPKPPVGVGGRDGSADRIRRSPRATPVRIVVADVNAIFRSGLRALLETDPEFEVVGEARTAAEAVAMVVERKADLLLLDLELPDASGIETLEQLRGVSTLRAILLTAAVERLQLLRALQLGVRGIVLKNTATDLLFKSIRAVMDGDYWISRSIVADLIRLSGQAPVALEGQHSSGCAVTDREREIVQAIVAGKTNREIAQTCSLSEDTVKHHLTSIFDKTGTSNRLELALYALHHRLVPQP